jgi:DNA-nicking Smr family endonuclease
VSTRRRRMLTSDEQALWAHVTQQVAPMAARAKARRKEGAAGPDGEPQPPVSAASPTAEAPGAKARGAKSSADKASAGPSPAPGKKSERTPGKFHKPAWKKPASHPAAPAPEAPKATLPSPPTLPLAPLERRLRQRLSRGNHPIDAVIDLHGMRQDEAHLALRGFLRSAQHQGYTVVLVVTGKGGGPSQAGGGAFEERGVLRRSVPHWLRLPDLRSVVVAFEEAVQHHGGGGALYVRIRRARSGP